MNSEVLKSFIEVKLAEREVFYNKAKIVFPGENFDHKKLLLELGILRS
jgi:hypothetical protein